MMEQKTRWPDITEGDKEIIIPFQVKEDRMLQIQTNFILK